MTRPPEILSAQSGHPVKTVAALLPFQQVFELPRCTQATELPCPHNFPAPFAFGPARHPVIVLPKSCGQILRHPGLEPTGGGTPKDVYSVGPGRASSPGSTQERASIHAARPLCDMVAGARFVTEARPQLEQTHVIDYPDACRLRIGTGMPYPCEEAEPLIGRAILHHPFSTAYPLTPGLSCLKGLAAYRILISDSDTLHH